MNATTNQCYPCNILHVGCEETKCTGIVTSHYTSLCTACLPGYYGPTKISIPGWSGFTSCGACPLGCATCTSVNGCSSCISATLNYINGACYCKNASLYYSSTSKSCITCGALYINCQTCVNSTLTTTCTSCITGYYLSSNTTCTIC